MSSKSIIKRFILYFRERFNLLQMLFLSLIFALAANNLSEFKAIMFSFISLFLVLLQLRLTDEFKDYDHDKKYYPERPVPRGLVTLNEIYKFRTFIYLSEILLLILGNASFLLFLILQTYFFLMSKEFYISKWLKNHFSFYIFLHEISAIPLFMYLMSFSESIGIFSFTSLIKALFLMLCLFALEIIRKIRSPKEYKGGDTYVENYGFTGAKILLVFVVIVASIFGLHLYKIGYNIVGFIFIILFSTLFVKKYKLLKSLSSISVVILLIAVIISKF